MRIMMSLLWSRSGLSDISNQPPGSGEPAQARLRSDIKLQTDTWAVSAAGLMAQHVPSGV